MSILRGGIVAIVGVATAVLMSLGAPSAIAATCGAVRVFEVAVATSCAGSGPGNIQGDNNDFAGYVFLDKWTRDEDVEDEPETLTGQNEQGFLNLVLSAGTSGTFAFTLVPGYTNFLIAFKSGEGQADPDWAGFLLPTNLGNGPFSWSISLKQALSHANLYAQVAAVPVPAGVLLLGSALGGLGLVGWRKNRKAKLAA